MSTVTTTAVLDALRWRYATKQFDPAKKIDPAVWAGLEESLVLTPSSFGLQPWQFLVIDDPAVRESLVPHAWGQRQVADASHLVVMAVRTSLTEADIDRFLDSIVAVRGGTREALAGYRGMMVGSMGMMTKDWAARQAYIALGQFMLACAMVGVDTCPMEGFLPAEFDRILGLTEQGLTAAVLCPAGYRAAGDGYAALPKVRWPLADVVRHV